MYKGKKLPIATNNQYYNSTIFEIIYEINAWGGKKGEFYSGTGSHNPEILGYAKIVANFIEHYNINQIVEIGCGDFNVTNTILDLVDQKNKDYTYIGYDVVKPLIERNKKMYESPKIKFKCKDSCTGIIKGGDLLIIRQVMQHLNNKSIMQIVEKFKNYKYIIFTEHQLSEKYNDTTVPNNDKNTDAATRLHFKSGVYLEKAPFNCTVHSKLYSFPEPINEIEASINTYLIKFY
jgi:hypothetical protein